MMTVRMWRFISSGEMINKACFFWISLPTVGSRLTRNKSKRLTTTATHPRPSGSDGQILVQESVIFMLGHRVERLVPPLARALSRANDDLRVLHFELYFSPRPLCSMRTFGMRMPCELPIRMMRVFMVG